MDVHYSSKTDNWATPDTFFHRINEEFGFDLDVCADADNAKASRYFTKEQDGLMQNWKGVCWMNPPYGREIVHWVRKAYESYLDGATVVCLVPARVDTAWWHDYCEKADEIRLLRGRLKFGGSDNFAPFPSALVVFGSAADCRVRMAEQKLRQLDLELDALSSLLQEERSVSRV